MPARKLAVSLDEDLAERVAQAAEEATGGNVSAWLAEAARESLRKVEGRKLLAELEGDRPVTGSEILEVRRQWPED